MHRRRSAVLGAFFLSTLLAACTAPQPPIPEPALTAEPAAASPKAFVFESGVLEFGDFDPYTLGDNLFNPCTEITEAEFAAAGFHNKQVSNLNPDLDSCSFDEPDGDEDFVSGFMNGDLNFALSEEAAIVLPQYESVLLPEMFAVRGKAEGVCYTQIDTARGGFGTAVAASPRRNSEAEICERAIQLLENFYKVHGRG